MSRGEGWHVIQAGAHDHPNVQEGRAVIPGGPSRQWIEDVAEDYGRDSPYFVARVEGRFPEGDVEGLFRRGWLTEAVERFEEGSSAPDVPGTSAAWETIGPVMGLDPARYGPDDSVAAIVRGHRLEALLAWKGRMDTMELTGRVVRLAREIGIKPERPFGESERTDQERAEEFARSGRWLTRSSLPAVGRIAVDEIGVGGGVADRLAEQGFEVDEFNGSKKPLAAGHRPTYANQRAVSYWRLRKLLEGGEIALPEDEELFRELMAIRWSPTSSGQIRIESKDEIKKRIGRSPDRADAVSMAFWAWDRQRQRSGEFALVQE